MLIIELLVTYIWIDMNKLIKFIYYNVFLGVPMIATTTRSSTRVKALRFINLQKSKLYSIYF